MRVSVCVRVHAFVYKLHTLLLLSVWRCWFSSVDGIRYSLQCQFGAMPIMSHLVLSPSIPQVLGPSPIILHPCAQPNNQAAVRNKIKMKGKVYSLQKYKNKLLFFKSYFYLYIFRDTMYFFKVYNTTLHIIGYIYIYIYTLCIKIVKKITISLAYFKCKSNTI